MGRLSLEGKKKVGVIGAIWEISALKGYKSDQTAKITLKGLEGQTRLLFHTILAPECESCNKSPNLVLRGQDLAHMAKCWAKIGPKLVQKAKIK